jgi:hypothetical protein
VAKTAEQVLRGAADYIREHGWLRGRQGQDGGPRCMVGAMWSIGLADMNIDEWFKLGALTKVIGGEDVLLFNDDHCKTANDAIAALEIAADLAA